MMKSILILTMTLMCHLSFTAQAKSVVKEIARPCLIVPGSSLGKVMLVQRRETVHQKMGKPAKSNSHVCYIYEDVDAEPNKETLLLDTWLRQPSDEEHRKRGAGAGWFEVFYRDDRVVQITTILEGYRTSKGLSVGTSFEQSEKLYGEATKVESNFDADSPTGISHAMASFWTFKDKGLTIQSHIYGGGDTPVAVFEISVHQPNQPYLWH